jgi:hypoxanthine-guanine phosphoribosyltransferase
MANGWYREKLRTLYTPDQIQGRIRELGAEITREYHGKSLVAC